MSVNKDMKRMNIQMNEKWQDKRKENDGTWALDKRM
jgi:hypothetical protein